MRRVGKYIYNLLYLLDKAGNTLTGGSPDETISRRAARAKHAGSRWGRWLCKGLDWIDPGHCEDARKRDLGQAWRGVTPDSDDKEDLR